MVRCFHPMECCLRPLYCAGSGGGRRRGSTARTGQPRSGPWRPAAATHGVMCEVDVAHIAVEATHGPRGRCGGEWPRAASVVGRWTVRLAFPAAAPWAPPRTAAGHRQRTRVGVVAGGGRRPRAALSFHAPWAGSGAGSSPRVAAGGERPLTGHALLVAARRRTGTSGLGGAGDRSAVANTTPSSARGSGTASATSFAPTRMEMRVWRERSSCGPRGRRGLRVPLTPRVCRTTTSPASSACGETRMTTT